VEETPVSLLDYLAGFFIGAILTVVLLAAIRKGDDL
jgi:hypothetical protein